MLNRTHQRALRAIAAGRAPNGPAVETLIATGLVERDHAPLRITPQGEAALAAARPHRLAALALFVLGVVLVLDLLATVVDWVT